MIDPLTAEEYADLAMNTANLGQNGTLLDQYKAWAVDKDVHIEFIHLNFIEVLREIFSGKKTVYSALTLNAFLFFEIGYAYALEVEKRIREEELNATED